ncbi:recombinase RecX [Burkholderia stagnalis]|uniref:Regulatory protein RecX n=1 Tax=Burkholderia stagnalis TaxID=1503054 RepID=A0A6L3MQQ1_9BURK|nr:recombination regulator RecX [Burkholderia stagnalis]KAB0634144.1 recombination regulator RecX [Burkholderia stagnalis]KVO51749.1 recombinase RecX [Burkholderia stagnalis]KVO70576.1 recombinase RecX [Burkholderia stagnalis]KVW65027.1 recombinase RecX [Burkholderia stagnalis]KVW72977.1 recombinase RecX [Burkholderia stagnalis]
MVRRRDDAGEPKEHDGRDAPGGSGRRAASPGTGRRSAAQAANRTATRASDDALVSFEISAPDDPFEHDESFDAHDRARRRGSGVAFPRDRASAASGAATEDVYTRTSQNPRRTRRPSGARSGAEAEAGAGASTRASSSKPARSLKGRALGYLSRREYSRAELARKLAPYAGEDESVEPVLDALEQDGWLSDARFAESLVHRRASRVGAARIVNELKRHAVGDALVEEVNAQLRETEWARAQAVWRKKFGALPQTPAERAKQARFLAARGFSSATIVKLLKCGDELFGVD